MSGASSSFHLLDERIQRFIWAEGWESLRDAQEQSIPLLIHADRDLIVAAATAAGQGRAGEGEASWAQVRWQWYCRFCVKLGGGDQRRLRREAGVAVTRMPVGKPGEGRHAQAGGGDR